MLAWGYNHFCWAVFQPAEPDAEQEQVVGNIEDDDCTEDEEDEELDTVINWTEDFDDNEDVEEEREYNVEDEENENLERLFVRTRSGRQTKSWECYRYKWSFTKFVKL